MKKSSLTPNKIMAAFLIALAIAWIAGKVSDSVVEPKMLTKDAYIVDTSAIASAATATAAAPAEVTVPPVAPLLAMADPAAGEKDAKVCGTCHSFGKGEAAKIGPNLYGIIGLKHAHMEGYNYSDAMKALSGETWTFEALNKFLSNPRGVIVGTKMSFAGIKNDKDRADVIAWLRTLSDSPEPLPK